MAKPSHQDTTTAADKSIGFDYQFYYFMYCLLGLVHGEEVGLEVKDDIHITDASGKTKLIQTKHTIQKLSDGKSAINLTERDKDLWKTIYNWSKIILEQTNVESFLDYHNFCIVTNKNNNDNEFIKNLLLFQNKSLEYSGYISYLNALHDSTDDSTLKEYIDTYKKITRKTFTRFSEKIELVVNYDNIISKIKDRITEKIYDENKAEDVYKLLHSELRDQNYFSIKAGDKIVISFETFMKRYSKCFAIAGRTTLPIRNFDFELPENPADQVFIKQLIDIGDISITDNDLIVEFTTQMLKLYNNITEWISQSELLQQELESFNSNSKTIWKTIFREKYRIIKKRLTAGEDIINLDNDIKAIAIECIDQIRKENLSIDQTLLDRELSNGQFYLLSEIKEIGWHYDWQNRY